MDYFVRSNHFWPVKMSQIGPVVSQTKISTGERPKWNWLTFVYNECVQFLCHDFVFGSAFSQLHQKLLFTKNQKDKSIIENIQQMPKSERERRQEKSRIYRQRSKIEKCEKDRMDLHRVIVVVAAAAAAVGSFLNCYAVLKFKKMKRIEKYLYTHCHWCLRRWTAQRVWLCVNVCVCAQSVHCLWVWHTVS